MKKTAETHKLAYPLSISAGYAYYQPDIDFDFKDIVRRSDTMLYRQKRRKKMVRSTGLGDICFPVWKSIRQRRLQMR